MLEKVKGGSRLSGSRGFPKDQLLVLQMNSYPIQARRAFEQIDQEISSHYPQIVAWRGWRYLNAPVITHNPRGSLRRNLVEAMRLCQIGTDEAAWSAIGRISRTDPDRGRRLRVHREQFEGFGFVLADEHGMDRADGLEATQSPALFALSAVWHRLATTEEVEGYLGAEYASRRIASLLLQMALPGPEDHGDENDRHGSLPALDVGAELYRTEILTELAACPRSIKPISRCASFIAAIFPLMVWDEVLTRYIAEEHGLAA